VVAQVYRQVAGTAEARRVRALVGTRIPVLPGIEPLAPAPFTVLYCYPGTNMPAAAEIPGAAGWPTSRPSSRPSAPWSAG